MLWIGGDGYCQTANDFVNYELYDIILPINTINLTLAGSGIQNNILQQIYNLDSLDHLYLYGYHDYPEIIQSSRVVLGGVQSDGRNWSPNSNKRSRKSLKNDPKSIKNPKKWCPGALRKRYWKVSRF